MAFHQILWICLAAITSPIAIFYGVLAVRMWLQTRAVLGPVPLEGRLTLRRLLDVSRQGDSMRFARVALMYCGLGVLVIAIIARELLGLAVAFAPFVLIAWMHVRTTTPPVVLILGTSTHSSVRRQRAIKRRVSPLRVVSLLAIDVPWDAELASEMALDCFRTTNEDDWWVVIIQLMDFAPILAIDAAAETSGVFREASHVFGANLTHKCLFLTPEDESAPVLDRVLPMREARRQDLRMARYQEAPHAIASMVAQVRRRRKDPSQHSPT